MILIERDVILKFACVFNENPGGYIFGGKSSDYNWPDFSGSLDAFVDIRDMFFKMPPGAKNFAYVQGVFCHKGVAYINHLAVEVGCERLGIGRALVKYLARELSARYQVQTLLFTECHPRKHDKEFFQSLGAIGIPRPPLLTPDWRLPVPARAEDSLSLPRAE